MKLNLPKKPFRPITALVTCISALLIFVWLLHTSGTQAQAPKNLPLSPKDSSLADYAYMGAASCSGSACHGSTTPRTKLSIPQNEFFIWWEKDSHAKAYEVLTKPESQRMAQNLGVERPEKSQRCLTCHAVEVDEDHHGPLFDLTEGVTCEACHGPAEKWLGPHTRKDWNREKAASLGMFNTKDLGRRSERCLACHLGTAENLVNHELIGAGHPRLKFEIDNYSAVMPSHWLPPKEKDQRDWLGAKAWAVGQAVALRNQMQLLIDSRKSQSVLWPDLIHFDCYACHHDVVPNLRDLTEEDKKLQRWRVRDYGGKPGRLVWNASAYTVFRHVVGHISPEQGQSLDQLVTAFHDALTGKGSSAEFETTLNGLMSLTELLVPLIEQYRFTKDAAWSLMRTISGDAHAIANAGFQSAEQAVLALASLYDAYADAVGLQEKSQTIQESIDVLYQDIKEGRLFNPSQFEQDMTKLRGYLEPEGPQTSGSSPNVHATVF